MRLIDADALINGIFVDNPKDILLYIAQFPEIIRCKDCRHIHDNDCPIDWGKTDYDFCSFAEE